MTHIVVLLVILGLLGLGAVIYGAVRGARSVFSIGVVLLAVLAMLLLALWQSQGAVLIGTNGPRLQM